MRVRSFSNGPRGGFALLTVLLVLIALLVLSAPFLLMARNADRSSVELTDRAQARLGLDAAGRHARVLLGESHPGVDRTPYFDSHEEVAVDNRFDPAFLDPNDEGGLMWDLDGADVAGQVDLNSAPPQMLANLMGLSTRLTRAIKPEEKEVPLATTKGLEPAGVVWVDGELLRYVKIADGGLVEPLRGILGPANPSEWRGGPLPPSTHDAGAPVIDQRAIAPALWRIASGDGEVRAFDAKERLREAGGFAIAAAAAVPETSEQQPAEPRDLKAAARTALSEDALRPLFLHGSVHGGVRGGQVWQRPTRLESSVRGGQDGILTVADAHWVNPGSTVQITDGSSTELALVQEMRASGEVVLDRILQNDYQAGFALVRVLARRPVNLNTAAPEVLEALFANLQVNGRNSRITRDEAEKLATLVTESRPFEGFEDFLRRVVLPAAGLEKLPGDSPVLPGILAGLPGGSGFIDPDDALALYMNGLNANDGGLRYSTMPYAFVSRDTYDLELRATVGAPSGVERFAMVREETDLVVPQRQLFALWARQEDFDEELRLDLEAPWWMTGPNATSRYDNGSVPPSRLWAELGTAKGQTFLPGVTDMSAFKGDESPPTAEHVFPSREETGWVHLWPSRVGWSKRTDGRVIHFDHETRDPEGRYLPDQVVSRSTDDTQVAWTSTSSPLCRPLAFSMWVKPQGITNSMLLDVGGTSHDIDRVSIVLENADLVLRVISAGGDHPDTQENEFAENRFAIARGTSPGLPLDIWSHVDVDVRGTRPDQIHMLVNGLSHGVRTPGLTRLTAGLPQNAPTVVVESAEGFPATCTVRVGNELVEVVTSNGTMSAARQETGRFAGYGGRLARVQYASLHHAPPSAGGPVDLPLDLATITVDHGAGTSVGLYGYSLPLQSNLPTGRAQLPADLTPFRAARLQRVEGGQSQQGDIIAVVDPQNPLGGGVGYGLEGSRSTATGLVLVSADTSLQTPESIGAEQFMSAFNPNGGYAAIVQYAWTVRGDGQNNTSVGGAPLGGVEVIRYSGWTGTTLRIAARGNAVTELRNLRSFGEGEENVGGARAFVAQWYEQWSEADASGLGDPIYTQLAWQTYVVPISLPVPGSTSANGYLEAAKGDSRFAQITHIDDAELTEWVRYDEIANDQLVRDDPLALNRIHDVVCFGITAPGAGTRTGPGGGGGPGGGPGSGPGGNLNAARATTEPAPLPPQSFSSQWDPRIGQSENADYPLSEAIETAFQFRGVFGTFSHAHRTGALVLPVFMTDLGGPDEGSPGRLDAAFLIGSNSDHLGWPVRVHRAHIPSPMVGVTGWEQTDESDASVPPTRIGAANDSALAQQDAYLGSRIYVALQAPSPEIMVADPQPATAEARLRTRLVCPPSGELPRIVGQVTIGGGFDGPQNGAIPSATVDEIVFGDAQFGRKAPADPETLAGSALVLSSDLPEAGLQFSVMPKTVRIAAGRYGLDYEFLGETPQDAGLLRIGQEIVCYDQRDTSNGQFNLSPNGRGLLGTRAQPHQITEPVTFLEHRVVSFLAAGLSAGDASIQIANIEDFPGQGTVLIGSELIHYTRIRGNALEMPRASSQPGRMDGKSDGLFRGRYGTIVATHAQGEPVILFPFRYWDRWASRADAPELAYFGLSIDQPSAYWEACFFEKEDAESCQLGILERVEPDAPWDADPENDKRLRLHWQGDLEGKPIPIHRQSDRIDWRVFVKYSPGAFDMTAGLAHGWKQTSVLKKFGAFYFGPGMVLSSVVR